MDIGAGIAISSGVFGIVAVVYKIIPSPSKGERTHCEEHSGVCAKQDSFDAWLNKIEKKLDRVIEGRKAE